MPGSQSKGTTSVPKPATMSSLPTQTVKNVGGKADVGKPMTHKGK